MWTQSAQNIKSIRHHLRTLETKQLKCYKIRLWNSSRSAYQHVLIQELKKGFEQRLELKLRTISHRITVWPKRCFNASISLQDALACRCDVLCDPCLPFTPIPSQSPHPTNFTFKPSFLCTFSPSVLPPWRRHRQRDGSVSMKMGPTSFILAVSWCLSYQSLLVSTTFHPIHPAHCNQKIVS